MKVAGSLLIASLAACAGPPGAPEDAGATDAAGLDATADAAASDSGAIDAGRDGGPADAGGPTSVVQLTTGAEHGCVRLDDGSAWCWGSNADGELGQGHTNPASRAVRVPLEGVTSVSAGAGFTCAKASGEVYCWGRNDWGQLGTGSAGPSASSPQRVDIESGGQIFTELGEVAVGIAIACVEELNRSLRCWGRMQTDPPMSRGPHEAFLQPFKTWTGVLVGGGANVCIEVVTDLGARTGYCGGTSDFSYAGLDVPLEPLSFVLGNRHACYIEQTPTGRFAGCAGDNALGAISPPASPTLEAYQRRVQDPVAIAAGAFSCAITTDGPPGSSVRCWGRGTGPAPVIDYAERDLPGTAGAVDLDVGDDFLCLVTGDRREVRCSGNNTRHQLGDGTTTERYEPVAVAGLPL